jgi:hypothetical protein
MTRLFATVAAVLLMAVAAGAQTGLTGKWEGTTPNGAALALDLTVKDSALTGTLTRADQKVTIADGKVTDNTFSFKATINEKPDGFSGELKGNELRIWLDRQGPENAITMTRVKK